MTSSISSIVLSRPPIVQPRPQHVESDFDPVEWAAQGQEGTAELGLDVRPPEATAPLPGAGKLTKGGEVCTVEIFRLADMTTGRMREAQGEYPFCAGMVKYKEKDEPLDDRNLGIIIERRSQFYVIREGVLYHIVRNRERNHPDTGPARMEQLVVPTRCSRH